jgi:hypothetical protein
MTMPEGAAPKGAAPKAARGKGAKAENVEVYKILKAASEPLTVPQIADRMPKTGYESAAMNAYREHKQAVDPTWLEGKTERWSSTARREAMVWWVRKIVRSLVHSKNLKVNERPVVNQNTVVREGAYLPGMAPKVRRIVWVEEATLIDWTPELSESLNRGHVAGMEFTKRYTDYRCDGKKHTKAEAEALLELADRAIRPHHG